MTLKFSTPNTCRSILVFSLFFICFQAKAQDKPNAMELVQSNLTQLGLSKSDLPNLYVSDSHVDKVSGALMVYLQQQYKSINVHNAVFSIAFKDGKVLSSSNTFVKKIQSKAPAEIPAISPLDAVNAAAIHLNIPTVSSLTQKQVQANGKTFEFDKGTVSKNDIPVNLVWVEAGNAEIRLAWNVHIDPPGTSDMWNIRVDAIKGIVLEKDNWTVDCKFDKHPVGPGNGNVTNGHPHASNAVPLFTAPAARRNFAELPLTNNAGYGVIPFPVESSIYPGGNQDIRTNPWLMAGVGNPAITYGWHFDGTTNYQYTRGNNVLAQDDIDANNATPGSVATSTTSFPDLNFLFPLVPAQPVRSPGNLAAGITNLFYWNNLMHDISYQYGFDEAAGNFQNDNLGRGGDGSDFVLADAQDGSGFDNANFSTPIDGTSGRMQMFLFSTFDAKLVINTPASIAGEYGFVEGNLSLNNLLINKGAKTGNVIFYNDDLAGTTHLACSIPANAAELNGNIALIDRGTCGFAVKIKNAQNAGAIAVIVVNNVPGPAGIMGSTPLDNTIIIPAVMVTQADGNIIKAQLQNNTVVNITLNIPRYIDGALDNSIVTHEYTHGISNRLTGGRLNSSCLSIPLSESRGMGEGWSDYYALMVTTDWSAAQLTDGTKSRTIGNFALDFPVTGPGIRTYPYSLDMSVNPLTYGDVAAIPNGQQHAIGEIWCATLWDLTWGIINMDGIINTNLYNANAAGGNSVALKLVTLGMKLQPCKPGFLDSRNAILKADSILYGGKYSCLIWRAFARRGMGVNAVQGLSTVYTDQVEDFNIPTGATFTKIANKNFVLEGDNLNYSLSVRCQCAPLTGLTLRDTLPASVTHLTGGIVNGNEIIFTPINLSEQQLGIASMDVKVNTGVFSPPVIQLTEPVSTATINNSNWTTSASIGTAQWNTTNVVFRSPAFAFLAPDSGSKTDFTLTTANNYPISRITTLSFWHIFDTETNWDGGVVELSSDNGASWIDAGPYMISNGYNSNIFPDANSSIAGRNAFTGFNGTFIQTMIDLSIFTGQSLKFRFRFCSDDLVGADGWYVDDIQLRNEAGILNVGYLYNGTTLLSRSFTRTLIPTGGALPLILTEFDAARLNQDALISWETSTEFNSRQFEVEKSLDGINFSSIGTIQAAGNSSTTRNYKFIDNKPVNGVNYYRLKQVDADGKITYSAIKTVVFDLVSEKVIITPNPSKGMVTVIIPRVPNAVPVNVYDNKGLLVYKNILNPGSQRINLSHLSKGIYLIHFKIKDQTVMKKLLIQ